MKGMMDLKAEEIIKIELPTPFAVGDVNVYLIKGEKLTLIDVGPNTDDAWKALGESLNNHGLSISEIEQVILTHHHPDHVGLLDRFPLNVDIHAHPFSQRWMFRTEAFWDHHDDFFQSLFLEAGLTMTDRLLTQMKRSLLLSCQRKVTGFLEEGNSIPGLEGWEVLETPGHAMGHLSFLRRSDGVLIGGDLLLEKITPNPLLEPPIIHGEARPKPLLQYIETLNRLLELPISKVYTGHGNEVENVKELIESTLHRQRVRAAKVKGMLLNGSKSAYELCKQLFPQAYKKELGLAMSETIGQLDYLLDRNEIICHIKDGQFLYSSV
jgi:glyoxylase-like metal-dependent hydrolase (beta-lactamase superfamily II)